MNKRDKILKALKAGKLITKWTGRDIFSMINIGGAIHQLRQKGYNIEMTMVTNPMGERYGVYRMRKAEQARLRESV